MTGDVLDKARSSGQRLNLRLYRVFHGLLALCVVSVCLSLHIFPVQAAGVPRKQILSSQVLADGPIDWFMLTPDGTYATFWSNDLFSSTPSQNIYRVPLDGSASQQQLNGNVQVLSYPQLTPDGKTLVFVGEDPGQGSGLYKVPVENGIPVHLSDIDWTGGYFGDGHQCG